MKSELVKFTDKAILDLICERLLRVNHGLALGEQMTAPFAPVRYGKIIKEVKMAAPANLVCGIEIPLDQVPKALPDPFMMQSISARVKLDDITLFNEEAFKGILRPGSLSVPLYLHCYEVRMDHREWLEKYDVGDIVMVERVDAKSFLPDLVPVILTQDLIDVNSYVTFRYGISPV